MHAYRQICIFVYVHDMYVYTYICIYIWIWIRTHIRMYMHIHVYIHLYACVCIYIYTYTYIRILHICMYVFMCVYVYICTRTCAYTYEPTCWRRTHCNTLQHTATHPNTLQHTATHCNTLQHTATHPITLIWTHVGTERQSGSNLFFLVQNFFSLFFFLNPKTWGSCHDKTTLSCVCNGSFIRAADQWHASFICVPWLIHMGVLLHSYVCHNFHLHLTRLFHMYHMTHRYMWYTSDVFTVYRHSLVRNPSDRFPNTDWITQKKKNFILCVLWRVYMCNMIRQFMKFVAFVQVP